MRRALVIVIAVLAAGAPSADAAVVGGSQPDAAEGAPRGDLAFAAARYDDATGALELVADLHAAPAPGEPPMLSWVLSSGFVPAGRGCDAAQQSMGVEVPFEATGDAVVRFQRGEEEEVRVPAQVRVERGGLRLRITATDARLADVALACAQLSASSGDDVAPLALAAETVAPGGPGTPGAGGPQSGDDRHTSGYDFRRRTLSTRRRSRRTVEVTVRALVCGPRGTIRVRVRHALRRRDRTGFTRARTSRFTRVQRRRCQQHRFTWRVGTATNRRYAVRADLRATRLAERPRAAAPPLGA